MNWLRELFGSKTPEATSPPTHLSSLKAEGNVIYRGLIREMHGSLGTRVQALLLQSCKQTQMTAAIPTDVVEWIHANSLAGTRAEGIAKALAARLPDIPHNQLISIVRTIVGKANVALNRARSEEVGLHWYVWETCQDVRVRKSHQNMQGVIVAWRDPPAPEAIFGEEIEGKYHAGESYDCRCISSALLTLSDVRWPHRVYHQDKIMRMLKNDFKRLSGIDV